jgi:hypothetical protein
MQVQHAPFMTELRVRVELVDAPGALATVTTALAALGVDVAALDVLEVDGRTVVDELLLRLPDGTSSEEVEDALRLAGAVDVLSSVRSRSAHDAAVRAFDLVRQVLAAPADADAKGRALARCAYADFGMLVDVAEAARFPLAARALVDGVPATGRAAPDAGPLALTTGWVLWVAPQVSQPTRLAVVGRRLNVRFAATEAARLRAFATLLEVADRQPACGGL